MSRSSRSPQRERLQRAGESPLQCETGTQPRQLTGHETRQECDEKEHFCDSDACDAYPLPTDCIQQRRK